MNTVTGIAVCSVLLCSVVAAQKQPARKKAVPASAYKLIALKGTGTTRYTDKEVLAASGLQMGQNAADGDFKEVVQLLGDSGMFSNVAYSYSSSATGTKLELQLADIDSSKLLPVQFENFIWFTDEQLLNALHKRVPLFKQLLPVAGNLSNRVNEALQALLTEGRFPGRVNFERSAGKSGNVTAIAYRVEEVSIRIHGVEFPGASPEQATQLTAAARRLIGAEYGRPELADVAEFDLMPIYLRRGYLKAQFGPSGARIVPQSAPDPDAQGPPELQVDALIPVTTGRVYSTSGVDWKGNQAISTKEVAPLLHLPLGEAADTVRLLRDIENVDKLYRSRGYMMVKIKTESELDDQTGTVRYKVEVIEGDLFKMGELEITGLDTQATARMREAWTLHEGQPYNADYARKFTDDARELLPRGVRWSVAIHETPDVKDKTVDVEIRFKQE
jgi:outer membrane protein assembly factor BamA